MRDMTEDERLALLVSLEKVIKPQLDESKDFARYALMESYETDGVEKKAIKVDGQKVGEVGLSYTKERPVCLRGMEQDLVAVLEPLGLVEKAPKKGWESHFSKAGDAVVCDDTGEVVACLQWEPSKVRGASVGGCEPEKVKAAFGGMLAEATERLMLGGSR